MMHRILRKSDGVTVEELSTKLLADVKLVATRLAQLGREAICDSLADLEWLADKAFDLGIECIAASEAGTATDAASGSPSAGLSGATEDERLQAVDYDTLRRSTEFVSASCELRERLPGSDHHLQRLMQGQMVLCRGCVLLAKRRLPAEQRTLLLAKAAKAVEMALRAYGCTARSRGQLVKRTAPPRTTVPCAPCVLLSARVRPAPPLGPRPCAAPPHRREPHPLNNVTRPHGLSLGRPKGEATLPSMTDRRVETPQPDVGPMLQLLQFEVDMRRDDPSTRVWLQRAAETEGLTAEHVEWMGVICLEQRTRGAAQPAWPLLQQRPCARPAALRLSHGCQGERPEPQGKLASRNLSGSHASAYAARWTNPCVQAHQAQAGARSARLRPRAQAAAGGGAQGLRPDRVAAAPAYLDLHAPHAARGQALLRGGARRARALLTRQLPDE